MENRSAERARATLFINEFIPLIEERRLGGMLENTKAVKRGPTIFITAKRSIYTEVKVIGSLIKLSNTISMGTKTYEKIKTFISPNFFPNL
jgi:hypothetical protein